MKNLPDDIIISIMSRLSMKDAESFNQALGPRFTTLPKDLWVVFLNRDFPSAKWTLDTEPEALYRNLLSALKKDIEALPRLANDSHFKSNIELDPDTAIASKILELHCDSKSIFQEKTVREIAELRDKCIAEIRPIVPVANMGADVFLTFITYNNGLLVEIPNIGSSTNTTVITQVTPTVRFTQIYSNSGSAYLLTENRDVFVQGMNSSGQLGLPDPDYSHFCPNIVKNEFFNSDPIARIISQMNGKGGVSAAFIAHSGKLYCSGSNVHGLFGIGHDQDIRSPALAPLPDTEKVIDVKFSSQYYTMLVLTENGFVYRAGHAGMTFEKLNFPDEVKIRTIEQFDGDQFYLSQDGEVYATGNNSCGLLGVGDDRVTHTPKKTIIPNNERVSQVRTYGATSFFLTESGKLFGCGMNYSIKLERNHPNVYDLQINAPQPIFSSGGNPIMRCVFHEDVISATTTGDEITLFFKAGYGHATIHKIPSVTFTDYYMFENTLHILTDVGMLLRYNAKDVSETCDILTLPNNDPIIRIDRDSIKVNWYLSTSNGNTYEYIPYCDTARLMPIPPLYSKSKRLQEIMAENPSLQNKSGTDCLLMFSRQRATKSELGFDPISRVRNNTP